MKQPKWMRKLGTAGAGAVLAASVAACGGEGAAGTAVLRDSAGIRIAENDAPAWREGRGWRVGEEPALDIGVMDGDAAYQFNEVRRAQRLPDGRILVVDGGSSQLRLYGPDGRHLRSLGREGGGPGEFGYLGWGGAAAGDTLLAWDPRNKRLTVYAPDGTLARTVQPEGLEGMFPPVHGLLADGSLLASGGMNLVSQREGERRDTLTYRRFAADGRDLGSPGRYPGPERFTGMVEGLVLIESIVFGRDVLVRPGGGGVLVADNDRYEVRFHDADGALRRIVRRAHQPVRAEAADVDAFFAARAAERGGMPAGEEARFARIREKQKQVMPRRETFPALRDVREDSEGNLWVEEYRRPADEQPRWSVFDPQGRWLGTVETPAEFRVMQIGPDWILGVQKDELDVEHVVTYPLVKPAR